MIDNDDMLHRVDRHYLGPTGFTLPFRLRYGAVGLGTVITAAVFVVARAIVHVPLGFQSLVVIVAVGVVITARVTKYVNADRPLRSVATASWNDLIAPRPPKPGQTVVLRIPAAFHTSRSTDAAASNEGNSTDACAA
uniref:Putative transmembrane protein n=1 Tax=Rhodococcus sp. PY11 TaxID=551544 RepID=B5MA96_9NOCA|nr:putative transmembrane protein [Rhodococcus sp. PY11]